MSTAAMPCPDENSLARLLDGAVLASERQAIEQHLDGCGTCSVVVAELARIMAPRAADAAPGAPYVAHICCACGTAYPAAGTCGRDGAEIRTTHDPLLGGDVGAYRFVCPLGEGGMGKVYVAIQREVGGRVAIKVIHRDHAEDPDLAKRFLVEARAVNRIHHAGIVKVLDLVHLGDGRPAIVMELIEGSTLREAERAGELPIAGVVDVMIDVLATLAAAHAIGIVHRDLKPDNILLSSTGPRVLDFGIAKVVRMPIGMVTAPRTRTGALLGTPAYMAPEQVLGVATDARCDVYAAGIVLFEALAGELPFRGMTDFEVMRAQLESSPPNLCELRPAVPRALERVIACALAKRPEDRFTSAGAMANALRTVMSELAITDRHSLGGPDAIMTTSSRSLATWAPPNRDPTARRDDRGAGAVTPIAGARTDADAPDDNIAAIAQPTSSRSPRRRARWWLALAATAGVATIVIAPRMFRSTGSEPLASDSPPPKPPSSIASPPPSGANTPITTSAPNAPAGTPAPAPVASPAPRGPRPGRPSHPSGDRPDWDGSDAGSPSASSPPAPTATGGSAISPITAQPFNGGLYTMPFNGKRVDPVGFLATAEALARKLEPDAELTSMSFGPVRTDGTVVTGAVTGIPYPYVRGLLYVFVSRNRARELATSLTASCQISVWIDEDGTAVNVARAPRPTCSDAQVKPQCTAQQMWAKALAIGFDPKAYAQLAWSGKGVRFAGIRAGAKDSIVLADDCPVKP